MHRESQPPDAKEDQSSTATDVHLVLLLPGLYGSSANLWCLEEEIALAHEASHSDLELHVLNASGYGGAHTWDGIDVNAHRVAQEVSARPRWFIMD